MVRSVIHRTATPTIPIKLTLAERRHSDARQGKRSTLARS